MTKHKEKKERGQFNQQTGEFDLQHKKKKGD